jgi:hypothetical protein
MRFPAGELAPTAKAVAEARFFHNEIAASLAVTQLQQGFTTDEMRVSGVGFGKHF